MSTELSAIKVGLAIVLLGLFFSVAPRYFIWRQ